jgi:hypothetical protein
MDMENKNLHPGLLKKVVLFFIRFIASSLVLYTVWTKVGIAYMYIMAWGARPLLALAGYDLDIERAKSISEDISLNPVVFLSLVIAVTGVPLSRRIRPAILGVVILTAANIITVFLVFLSFYTRSESLWSGTEFLNLTINFFLPLLLWFILMPKGDLLPSGS